MSAAPRAIREPSPPVDDTVMSTDDVVKAIAGHPDADMTIALGATLVDVFTAQYDAERDKVVLQVLPEDLADAVARLARDGLTVSHRVGQRQSTRGDFTRVQPTD